MDFTIFILMIILVLSQIIRVAQNFIVLNGRIKLEKQNDDIMEIYKKLEYAIDLYIKNNTQHELTVSIDSTEASDFHDRIMQSIIGLESDMEKLLCCKKRKEFEDVDQ